jgi:hypothetical protein
MEFGATVNCRDDQSQGAPIRSALDLQQLAPFGVARRREGALAGGDAGEGDEALVDEFVRELTGPFDAAA